MRAARSATVPAPPPSTPIPGMAAVRPNPPTSWEQTQTLFKKSYLLKRGAWKMTSLELFIPLYPLFFLYFILELDFIPYKLFEVDATTYAPQSLASGAAMMTANVPAGVPGATNGLWRANPASLAFAPKGDANARAAVGHLCRSLFEPTLEVDFNGAAAVLPGAAVADCEAAVTWFDTAEELYAYTDKSSTNATKLIAKQMACESGSLCAGVVFDAWGNADGTGESRFTVVSNDLSPVKILQSTFLD